MKVDQKKGRSFAVFAFILFLMHFVALNGCVGVRGKISQTSLTATIRPPLKKFMLNSRNGNEDKHSSVSVHANIIMDKNGYATADSIDAKNTYRIEVSQGSTLQNSLDISILAPDHLTTVSTARFTLAQTIFEPGTSATIECDSSTEAKPIAANALCKLEDFTAAEYRYPQTPDAPSIASCKVSYQVSADFVWSPEILLSSAYSSSQGAFRLAVTCFEEEPALGKPADVIFQADFGQK